ncbi:MAG: thioredoxin family protein [Candidatus Alcyoniella australis]|nr:thioredoxin family protein [Candidatus Alcyoniella australis]
MKIEVLGPGCTRCERTYETVRAYLEERGLQHELVKVDKVDEIIKYGLLAMPALVIEGKVVLSGKVPRRRDLEKLLG